MRKAYTTFKLSPKNKFDFPNELVTRILTLRHFEGLPDLTNDVINTKFDKTCLKKLLY